MEKILTNAQMRAADAYTINNLKIPSETLMKRAGLAIANEAERAANSLGVKNVTVVCGTGNNGGDGYVCAEVLSSRGYEVTVCRAGENFYDAPIIVDCLFGTGLCRPVEGEIAELIEKINSSGAFVVAADIPSGLNGDNGLIEGVAVKANVTVAVAEYKAGYFLSDGLDLCGEIIKKDIGIVCPEANYARFYTGADIAAFYPKRKRNSNKGTFGTAQLIAGSDKYIGAAALAAETALNSGCGYVKLVSGEKVRLSLAPKLPQVIFNDEPDLNADCIALGMGCGVTENLYKTIKTLLKSYRGTIIIDADGINSLAKFGVEVLKDKTCSVVLTPHLKEFSRLSGLSVEEIARDSLNIAKNFAKEYGVTLLLKSSSSVLTDGENTAILHRGNSALAKGGSGDMLSGLICGTVARGLSAFDGTACAAYTMGLTAEICAKERTEYCVTSKDLLKNLHLAVKRLTNERNWQ